MNPQDALTSILNDMHATPDIMRICRDALGYMNEEQPKTLLGKLRKQNVELQKNLDFSIKTLAECINRDNVLQ